VTRQGQTIMREWPAAGQTVKSWPAAGQTLTSQWPAAGQTMMREWPAAGQTVNSWPEAGKTIENQRLNVTKDASVRLTTGHHNIVTE
jgi:hypothetical protein